MFKKLIIIGIIVAVTLIFISYGEETVKAGGVKLPEKGEFLERDGIGHMVPVR